MNFEQMYQEYAMDVYRYALSLCHDPHLAEELTQETFYQALLSISRFDGTCKLRVWLCQILKHKYYQHVRKNNRYTELDQQEPSSKENLHHQILIQVEYEDLLEKLKDLSQEQQAVILLHGYYQMTFRSIGELLDKSENWCRVNFYRCKCKLRNRRNLDE